MQDNSTVIVGTGSLSYSSPFTKKITDTVQSCIYLIHWHKGFGIYFHFHSDIAGKFNK